MTNHIAPIDLNFFVLFSMTNFYRFVKNIFYKKFRMFGAIVWNLLIIEPFFHWIFWKTKIEIYIETWGVLGIIGKPFTKFDLINLIS
jgi:hypothetical protein